MKGSAAYLWYPQDFLADRAVMLMTAEQEGVYRRLIDICWIEGSIPDDVNLLAALARVDPERMDELWRNASGTHRTRLCDRFAPHGDAEGELIHERLEAERAKEQAHQTSRRSAEGSEAPVATARPETS